VVQAAVSALEVHLDSDCPLNEKNMASSALLKITKFAVALQSKKKLQVSLEVLHQFHQFQKCCREAPDFNVLKLLGMKLASHDDFGESSLV
jgi:hypothetical protein